MTAILRTVRPAKPNSHLSPLGFAYVAAAVALLVGTIAMNIYGMGAGPADGLTYLAAGERLNAGHELYALSPGDRPVEIKPPFWTVPLLSPPTIGVIWRPLALLPDELGVAIWWLGTMAAVAAVPILYLRRRPILAATALLVFLFPLVYEFPSANVNGFILFGVVGVWFLAARGHNRAAGIAVALMTAVKITPIVLMLWFVAQRRAAAVWAYLVTGAVIAMVTVTGAGIDNTLAYLDVVVDTNALGTTQFSLAGLLRRAGLASDIARFMPWVIVVAGASLMWARRDRPNETYAVAVFTMVWGSPVMNFDWLAILLGALAPAFAPTGDRSSQAQQTSTAWKQ